MTPNDTDWLALALASESNAPHEWIPIAWVIRHRRDTGYRKKRSIVEVVLDKNQFSYFNEFTANVGMRGGIFERALEGYAGRLYEDALPCAAHVLAAAPWQAPFGPDVRHYWSPVSMKPRGSKPHWHGTGSRFFTPSGIDPQRFIFEAGIK